MLLYWVSIVVLLLQSWNKKGANKFALFESLIFVCEYGYIREHIKKNLFVIKYDAIQCKFCSNILIELGFLAPQILWKAISIMNHVVQIIYTRISMFTQSLLLGKLTAGSKKCQILVIPTRLID